MWWGLGIVILIIGTIALMHVYSSVVKSISKYRLVRSGRTMQWSKALSLVRQSSGCLVDIGTSASLLPGCIWWISQLPDDKRRWSQEIHEMGVLVIDAPKAYRDVLDAEGLGCCLSSLPDCLD
jgi:hypothetical protein